VQRLQTLDNLDYDLPNVLFFHELFGLLAFADSLKTVAIVCKLHNNAAQKLK
jgi:hypothetical protein